MASIYPGSDQSPQAVAQVLLDIVGPARVAEVRTGTLPLHFEVPDDVAVEYERRLTPAAPAERQIIRPVRKLAPASQRRKVADADTQSRE